MIPLPLLTGGASFILGAVSKIFMMRMEMKHEEQKALMAKAGIVQEARKFGLQDAKFSFTRRLIALSLTAAVLAPLWGPLLGDLLSVPIAVAIPTSDVESTKVLFGLFAYTDTTTTYRHITTMTYLPEYDYYFTSVLGLYFGTKR